MSSSTLRKLQVVFLLLMLPIGWLATRFDAYQIDGDAVGYMDIADLMRAHHYAGVVNAYWHPLYPFCLAVAQAVFHPTRFTELAAYYNLNYAIFLLNLVAILAFTGALSRLRERMTPDAISPLLPTAALHLIGLALVVIASQRELAMGRVRPDFLLQALILFGLAALMRFLATSNDKLANFAWPALMGASFGLAYLAKSFAFLLALLAMTVLVLFSAFLQKRGFLRSLSAGVVAFVVFAAIAGPYIAALSRQKHHFDFGDSGALNYAWYDGGTEKMHLEPWMTSSFGSATVHLTHPEKQLLASPGIYSYKALPYGTYPPWFDTTYFNDGVKPHFNLHGTITRDKRNVALLFRYLFNHPEPLVLLALLLVLGASFRSGSTESWWHTAFWIPAVALGLAMWFLYGIVNIEERYVTVAYIAVLLPIFAALKHPAADTTRTTLATVMVVLFAFLPVAESFRLALENRRNQSVAGLVPAWHDHQIFGAAKGLIQLGVKPGDEVGCIGTRACLYDIYWVRLTQTRLLTEIYEPNADLNSVIDAMPNRAEAYDVVRREGAKVIVGYFDPGKMTGRTAATEGWIRLGITNFYALPLNLPPTAASSSSTMTTAP